MGCNCEDCNNSVGSVRPSNNECITGIVKKIVKAQHQAVEAGEDTCFTGCDQSIADLLSPFEENRDRLRHNTIPFILTCKGNCKPFIGSGVHRVSSGGQSHFKCVESPILRAKSFVGNSDTCVRLELLLPVSNNISKDLEESSQQKGYSGKPSCHKTVCDFFPSYTRNFKATGICITVDLNCFCGISCLSPITPLSAN